MVSFLTIPMACASALSLLLSAVFTFLSFRLSELGEKPSRLYPLFAFLGLANGIFLCAFCFLVNAAGNDLLRNAANRALVASASLVFPIAAHFYVSYFGLGGSKLLKAFLAFAYSSAALFAIAVLPPWRLFLGWGSFPTSRWYSGCEYGPVLFAWGAWAAAMMALCILILVAGSIRELRARSDRVPAAGSALQGRLLERPLAIILLSAANIAWFVAGILDDLTSIRLIDLPPLTWIGSFLIVTAIAFILCDEFATIYGRMQSLYQETARDPLTGSGTRAFFNVRFEHALAESRRSAQPLYLVLADCDDFKAVNDNLGHALGDEVLKAVAAEFARHLRPYDTVARFGGDEFLIMPRDVSTDEGARQLCARLLDGIFGLRVAAFGKTASASCSLGAARLDPGEFGLGAEEARALLIHRADAALYRAKEAGKGRCAFEFDDPLRAEA